MEKTKNDTTIQTLHRLRQTITPTRQRPSQTMQTMQRQTPKPEKVKNQMTQILYVQSYESYTEALVMTDTDSDSKTLDVQLLKTRFTERLTVKCDPKTKKALKQFCVKSGLSLCQIFDALAKAYLYGVSDQIDKLGVQSPTINLSIERSVQRVRRYSVEETAKEEIGGWLNYYQGADGLWLHGDVDEFGLNVNGHVVGCGCLKCRGKAEK